jgi:hypothetical protein
VRLDDMIPVYPEDVICTDEMDLSKTVLLEISKQYNGIMKRPNTNLKQNHNHYANPLHAKP